MEFVAELVGFVVIVFVLWRYVLPLVRNLVTKRQDEVQRQVDDAVQRAEAEGARIRDDARADATRIREEQKQQAEDEVERMLARGREQLVAERDQAVRRLRAEVSGASMELAERRVRATLDDEDARGVTVESFLSEIENLPSPRSRATTASSPTSRGA